MEVYAIRHGQSLANRDHRHSGWDMTPLSEKGAAESEKLGRALQDIAFDRVFSSDTQRAVETLQRALPGTEAEFSPDLRETGVGLLSGLTYAACEARYGEAYGQMRRERDFTPAGGENLSMHYQRVSRFMRRLEEMGGDGRAADGRAAVFCHEGTIKCMLFYILGMAVPFASLHLDNDSVTIFRLTEKGWVLIRWNTIIF